MSTSRRIFLAQGLGAAGLLGLSAHPSMARNFLASDPAELIAKGVAYLRPRQGKDGSWSGDRNEPGITALVVTALLRTKRVAPEDPSITKALGFLEQFVGAKGGLSEAPHSVYSTSVALMAF